MKEQGLAEILDRIEQRAHEIYVRDTKDGVIGSYRLTELSAEQALKHVIRWVRERMEPPCAWEYVNLFCPICGAVFRYGVTKGTYHSKEWGHLCSKECYQKAEMKYARMILGKDDV